MKAVLSLLAVIGSISFAQAGGFGGPPPFTNGSPLSTGTNGSYQASLRGNNLSGVLSFTMTGGLQNTSSPGSFAIFYQGQVYTGTNTVAIMDGDISGVLAGSPFGALPEPRENSNTSGGATTSVTITAETPVSGYFNASLDNKSPTGAFSGKGEIAYVVTVENSDTGAGTSSTSTETFSQSFKIKGVRVAIPTS